VVHHRKAARIGEAALDRHQHARGEVRVTGVLLVAADGSDRHLVDVGVEVTADDDQRVGVGVEQPVDQQADLQRLASPLYRREKEALRPAGHAAPSLRVSLLAGHEGGARRAQVHVDDVQHGTVVHPHCCVQDRPVPLHRRRLAAPGGFGSDRPVQRRRDEIVQNLPLLAERQAAEDHQVVLVAEPALAAADGAGAMEALVGGIGEQRVERRKPPRAAPAWTLAVDLLQAQDVGAQPQQLRPQQADPLLQRRPGNDRLAQILDVESGDAQGGGWTAVRHARAPLSRARRGSRRGSRARPACPIRRCR
jgi:hypothetical protein